MQPVLFTVPGLGWEVQAYGFFLGLALVLGWGVAMRLAAVDKLPAERLGIVYVLTVALALFAGRSFWLLQHPEQLLGWQAMLTLQAGTLAPFPGIVVGLVVAGGLASRRRVPVAAWYDVLTPAFAVGVVLERLGAFFAGTGFGRFAPDVWVAVRFGAGSPAMLEHQLALNDLLSAGATESLPVYPTQLYGALLGAVGVGLCWWLRRNREFSGQVFLGYSIFYLLAREFVEEFMRADAATGQIGPFNTGQIAAGILMVALGGLYALRRRAVVRDASLRAWQGGPWSPGYKHKPSEPSRSKTSPKTRHKPKSRKGRGKQR